MMKVLVIADNAEERKEIRGAVLEALQGNGECLTTSHAEGRETCLHQKPDLVVICDYDEVSPMAASAGFQSYCRISEIMTEENTIRFGARFFKYRNYCQTTLSLQALVYRHHRKRGGPVFALRH